jgi:hypothetical protein
MATQLASGTLVRTALVAAVAALAAGACGQQKPLGSQSVDLSTIPMMPKPVVGQATLGGHVLDADGPPVAGASVAFAEIDGSSSPTDAAGAYAVTVPSDSTLTLFASAAGFATTSRESIMLAAGSDVRGFDVMMLAPTDVTTMSALGGPDPMGTRGLVAVRLHSIDPSCVPDGGHVTVWPPEAAVVFYSRPSATGGLDAPDPTLDSVQPGAQIPAWLVSAQPPGNFLTIGFDGPGCALMAQSPSNGGLLFPGLRHVMAQALTTMDLFLTVTP